MKRFLLRGSEEDEQCSKPLLVDEYRGLYYPI
jgi:hypothetical protein